MSKTKAVSAGNLRARVEELSGESGFACYQWGMCSAGCPLAGEMDRLPRQGVRDLQLEGISLLDSNAMWVCASCLACEVRCPKGVDLAKLMEALRQLHLRKELDHVSINDMTQEEIRKLPQIALVAGFRKKTG